MFSAHLNPKLKSFLFLLNAALWAPLHAWDLQKKAEERHWWLQQRGLLGQDLKQWRRYCDFDATKDTNLAAFLPGVVFRELAVLTILVFRRWNFLHVVRNQLNHIFQSISILFFRNLWGLHGEGAPVVLWYGLPLRDPARLGFGLPAELWLLVRFERLPGMFVTDIVFLGLCDLTPSSFFEVDIDTGKIWSELLPQCSGPRRSLNLWRTLPGGCTKGSKLRPKPQKWRNSARHELCDPLQSALQSSFCNCMIAMIVYV